jgi:hypothetical protein
VARSGQSYFSRGYLEEVNAGNANTSNWLQGGGINQDGEIHAVNSFEAVLRHRCLRRQGRPEPRRRHLEPGRRHGRHRDLGMAEPLLYLGRNVKANSGGYGKYRGGCGFETLRMVWNAQDWTMFFMGNGYMNSDWGMMGGYPSATGYRFEAHKTGLTKERIAIGDSLPDLEQNVYGAVATQDAKGAWQVDEAATAKRREEMKKERIARSMPVREWIKQESRRVAAKDGAEQVQHMYASSFMASKKFLDEFRAFWSLPKDWILRLGQDGVTGFGQQSIPIDSLPDVRRVVLVDESVVAPEDY